MKMTFAIPDDIGRRFRKTVPTGDRLALVTILLELGAGYLLARGMDHGEKGRGLQGLPADGEPADPSR